MSLIISDKMDDISDRFIIVVVVDESIDARVAVVKEEEVGLVVVG